MAISADCLKGMTSYDVMSCHKNNFDMESSEL